jgi:hypothetical protein
VKLSPPPLEALLQRHRFVRRDVSGAREEVSSFTDVEVLEDLVDALDKSAHWGAVVVADVVVGVPREGRSVSMKLDSEERGEGEGRNGGRSRGRGRGREGRRRGVVGAKIRTWSYERAT